jgi:hypothetical protein
MFVLGHTVTGAKDVPEMSFDIAGTTGNIYKVVIGKEPTCSCPDAKKGNQCKHICYGKLSPGTIVNPNAIIFFFVITIILTHPDTYGP